MNKVAVVTGGGGFIGHHLVDSLSQDYHVVVLDNFSRGTPERLSNVNDNVTVLNCDITDYSSLQKSLSSYDVNIMFHLAAINGTGNFYKIPVKIMDVGVMGCFNVLKYVKENKVAKTVIASSAEVYQDCKIIPTPEDVPLVVPDVKNPRFSYGLSKIYTEYYSYQFGEVEDLNISIFRPHNVYGPNMGLQHVIPQFLMEFVTQHGQDGAVIVNAKGSLDAIRAFCYVDDIVNGIKVLAKHNQGVNVYNLGNNHKISMRDLVDEISVIMGCEYKIVEATNEHIGGTMLRCPDISKAEKLGFSCVTSLTDGLRATANWYINNENILREVTNPNY